MNAMLNDGNINEYSNGSDNYIGNRKVVIVMILKTITIHSLYVIFSSWLRLSPLSLRCVPIVRVRERRQGYLVRIRYDKLMIFLSAIGYEVLGNPKL